MIKLKQLIETPSDINEHLEIIKHYSSECEIVVEMGVRDVVSTWAILEGLQPKMTYIGVDVYKSGNLEEAKQFAKSKGVNFYFRHGSTLENEFTCPKCDFLFIDTLHTFSQLQQELTKHGNSSIKYLGFHDVVSFAYRDEDIYSHADKKVFQITENSGLLPAIFQFMKLNPHWKIDYFAQNNNGLLILKHD
jgi:hypothetical protein